MDTQVKYNIHGDKYMHMNEATMDELDKRLEEHCTKIGFPVGLRNAAYLEETAFAESRNNTFGASDSSVLLGVAYSSKKVTMKTKDELLQEKVEEFWNEEIGKLASVRKGKELEDFFIKRLENLMETPILKPSHMYINGKGLATNFDGVIFEAEIDPEGLVIGYRPVPMEIKLCTVWARKNYNWDKGISEFATSFKLISPDKLPLQKNIPIEQYIEHQANHYGIPKYYYTQLQQQMLFLNSDHGHLGVMDDVNWEMHVYTVHRDDHVIEKLTDEALYMYLRLCKAKGLTPPGK